MCRLRMFFQTKNTCREGRTLYDADAILYDFVGPPRHPENY